MAAADSTSQIAPSLPCYGFNDPCFQSLSHPQFPFNETLTHSTCEVYTLCDSLVNSKPFHHPISGLWLSIIFFVQCAPDSCLFLDPEFSELIDLDVFAIVSVKMPHLQSENLSDVALFFF